MAKLRIVGGNIEIYDVSELSPVLTLDRDEAADALLSYFQAAVTAKKYNRRRAALAEIDRAGGVGVNELPPSLAVEPNKPLHLQSVAELEAERDHWKRRVATASGFASAKAADDFRKACDAELARRYLGLGVWP